MGSGPKGLPAQVEAARILKSWGYATHTFYEVRKKRGPIYVTISSDLWGAIDIAAIRDFGLAPFRFVQVCQTKGVSAHRRKIEAVRWPVAVLASGVVAAELWEVRGEAFRLHTYSGEPYAWTVDQRLIAMIPPS